MAYLKGRTDLLKEGADRKIEHLNVSLDTGHHFSDKMPHLVKFTE